MLGRGGDDGGRFIMSPLNGDIVWLPSPSAVTFIAMMFPQITLNIALVFSLGAVSVAASDVEKPDA